MIARLLISPSQGIKISYIEKQLRKAGFTKNHPDLLYLEPGIKLGIAEARKIKAHFSLKPYSAPGRGAVLADVSEITIEAQNALLKTLEELPEKAFFILGANSVANLLPTVLSRCQIINLQNTGPSEVVTEPAFTKDIEKLVSVGIEERFAYIEKLKNKEELLHSLVIYFRNMLYSSQKSLPISKVTRFLHILLQAEEWAKQNVNIRGILEYLMLVMPSKL